MKSERAYKGLFQSPPSPGPACFPEQERGQKGPNTKKGILNYRGKARGGGGEESWGFFCVQKKLSATLLRSAFHKRIFACSANQPPSWPV